MMAGYSLNRNSNFTAWAGTCIMASYSYSYHIHVVLYDMNIFIFISYSCSSAVGRLSHSDRCLLFTV